MITLESPDGMAYVPARENASHPYRKLKRSDGEKALLVIDRYHIASSKLVLPSPFPPEMQFTLGEKDSSWKAIFLKS